MPITVDQQSLDAPSLGLSTVGQLISHLRAGNRLVVRLVIDGDAPDLKNIKSVNSIPLEDRTVYVETADPKEIALETLRQLDIQFPAADKSKSDAADLLRANQWDAALEKLSQCLVCWQQAEQAIQAIGRLFQVDLERLEVHGTPMSEISAHFASQLRDIQSALQSADLVGLTDVLAYDTAETSDQWRAALEALRQMISQKQPVQSVA